MSEQSETTAKTPSTPILCKMGCGFFGNNTTGGCCSKCWGEKLRREGKLLKHVSTPPSESAVSPVAPSAVSPAVLEFMDLEPCASRTVKSDEEKKPTGGPKKLKKKKASYKSMMAGIMDGAQQRDIETEKEKLREVTGGGVFSKVDKI